MHHFGKNDFLSIPQHHMSWSKESIVSIVSRYLDYTNAYNNYKVLNNIITGHLQTSLYIAMLSFTADVFKKSIFQIINQ